MPPIPLHIEDPITPSKAQGITSQTQADVPPPSFVNPTTTTSSASSSSTAARPGAAAVPAPTSAVPRPQPQATRTYNPPELSDLPAAPQPGAAPSANVASHANATSVPPPPRAGLPPPDQTAWAPPQGNLAPHHVTDTRGPTAPQRRGPVTLNLGPVVTGLPALVPSVSSHPPGYQQNVYAQELNSHQRASLDAQEEREKTVGGNVFGGLAASTPSTIVATEAAENVWENVKALGTKAGEGAARVHGEVWKWIDGKK